MLLPKQCWKDIPGYQALYQVSNTGRVRSLNYNRTGKIKILKQRKDKLGYRSVFLCKDGKLKKYSVHRLVALAFIPNPNNYPIINHKDENKINNTVWNLEWCTQEYNNNYGNRNKKISKAHKGKQFTEEHRKKISEAKKGKHHTEEAKRKMSEAKKGKNGKPVLMFTLDGELIKRFNCTTEANEYLGKDKYNKNINMCLRGKNKTAWGYKWKYEEDC